MFERHGLYYVYLHQRRINRRICEHSGSGIASIVIYTVVVYIAWYSDITITKCASGVNVLYILLLYIMLLTLRQVCHLDALYSYLYTPPLVKRAFHQVRFCNNRRSVYKNANIPVQ